MAGSPDNLGIVATAESAAARYGCTRHPLAASRDGLIGHVVGEV